MSSGSESASGSPQEARTAGLKAALASTATRTLALYFSRPVRLFRPSKISGWHSLRGQSLPLLIKQKGWIVIPRHFLPPLIVNALLGTVLWTTYSESTSLLTAHFPHLAPAAVAGLSGCCAGSVQALAAAPAENVRMVLEGGRTRGSWSVAWKEVFAGTESLGLGGSHHHHREEARKVRHWVREVREMAGRGWQGLGFGVAKDGCGFAVFFAIFDVSRRAAARARSFSERVSASMSTSESGAVKSHLPRIVHSTTVVSGGLLAGLAYELVCRPFDAARRYIHTATLAAAHSSAPDRRLPSPAAAASMCPGNKPPISPMSALGSKLREDGLRSFFRDPMASSSSSSPAYYRWLRTLGRVGPWGVAFLAWENFGLHVL